MPYILLHCGPVEVESRENNSISIAMATTPYRAPADQLTIVEILKHIPNLLEWVESTEGSTAGIFPVVVGHSPHSKEIALLVIVVDGLDLDKGASCARNECRRYGHCGRQYNRRQELHWSLLVVSSGLLQQNMRLQYDDDGSISALTKRSPDLMTVRARTGST